MTTIRAVLWDFGGVMTSSPFESFRRLEQERGLPEDFIRRVNATDPDTNAWARFERSEISLDEFDRLFEAETRAAGHSLGGLEVLKLLSGQLRPQMVEALRRLRPRYKTACLTNNVILPDTPDTPDTLPTPDPIESDKLSVMALFDVVVESSRVGVRKPDPRFYRMACEQLEIAPSEAVFLDDLGVNLKPARQLGMTTIKVVDPDQALAELEAILGLRLR